MDELQSRICNYCRCNVFFFSYLFFLCHYGYSFLYTFVHCLGIFPSIISLQRLSSLYNINKINYVTTGVYTNHKACCVLEAMLKKRLYYTNPCIQNIIDTTLLTMLAFFLLRLCCIQPIPQFVELLRLAAITPTIALKRVKIQPLAVLVIQL